MKWFFLLVILFAVAAPNAFASGASLVGKYAIHSDIRNLDAEFSAHGQSDPSSGRITFTINSSTTDTVITRSHDGKTETSESHDRSQYHTPTTIYDTVTVTRLSETQVEVHFESPDTNRTFNKNPLPDLKLTGTLVGGGWSQLGPDKLIEISIDEKSLREADRILAERETLLIARDPNAETDARFVIESIDSTINTKKLAFTSQGFIHSLSGSVDVEGSVTPESLRKNP